MRRTTIFRSSRASLLAAALLFAAANIQAQVTTGTGQQIQGPTVHVVQTGETLWELAQRYLGDPFLWPEIYRINTLVVEDPHWIFPGEELRLAPPTEPELVAVGPTEIDTVQALPVEPGPEEQIPAPRPVAPPPPPTETAPTVFQPPPPTVAAAARTSSESYRYRPVRRGEFYASGFLTEGEVLPWAAVTGRVGLPALPSLPASSDGMIFGEISIVAPAGALYQIGDSLLVARLSRELEGAWGQIVTPTGIVRVTDVAGSNLRAEIVAQFDRVSDGQSAIPLERFDDPGYVVPVPVQNGSMGEIVVVRDPEPLVGQQDIVFVNLGRQDGVALGDVFEILKPKEPEVRGSAQPWDVIGVMHIVHVRERSSTAFVLNVSDTGIGGGTPVRLIRKMPS